MKVLSLYQPWATLVAAGLKRCETRSVRFAHRGPLLIHAPILFPLDAKKLCLEEPFKSALASLKYVSFLDLPCGVIVGVVDVVDCQWSQHIRQLLSEQERAFGDYSYGRAVYVLENPICFETPIPAKGKQGLWNWEKPIPELERRVA